MFTYLEVINHDKVREERNQILNLKKFAPLEELNRAIVSLAAGWFFQRPKPVVGK